MKVRVIIEVDEPVEVNPLKAAEALIKAGYHVVSVSVRDRLNVEWTRWQRAEPEDDDG